MLAFLFFILYPIRLNCYIIAKSLLNRVIESLLLFILSKTLLCFTIITLFLANVERLDVPKEHNLARTQKSLPIIYGYDIYGYNNIWRLIILLCSLANEHERRFVSTHDMEDKENRCFVIYYKLNENIIIFEPTKRKRTLFFSKASHVITSTPLWLHFSCSDRKTYLPSSA